MKAAIFFNPALAKPLSSQAGGGRALLVPCSEGALVISGIPNLAGCIALPLSRVRTLTGNTL